ncbi:hypothetical protein ABK040_015214 [Willaertia magna]
MLLFQMLIHYIFLFAISLLAIILTVNCQLVSNTVTIQDVSGNGINNYPLQIGRAFIKGEVKTAPGVSFNGTILPSQSHVTIRYDDGSVRFATVSTVLPRLSRNEQGILTFFPYSSMPPKDESCSINELINQFPNLDIKITLNGNATTSFVSAKEMINKGYYQWVTQGSVRCELLVADHLTRGADFGLNGPKSFRPIFHFSFWRTIKTVRVRSVLENSNLDTLQDVAYNVTISHGVTNPTVLYSQNNINHIFGTRWTKVFWFGDNIPELKVNINHNVTYLAMTNMFPNYLANLTLTEAQRTTYYNNWLAKPKGIFEPGIWQKYQPTTGMRDDIGPMPAWKSSWLVMGDWRFREISLTSADLAGAWSAQFREVDPALKFDREMNVSAVGRPISVNAHPKLWFPDNNGFYAGALKVPRLPRADWHFDAAHQPDPFSVAYMLTGDFYYLEGLQLWAALSATRMPSGQHGRGKDGYAGITDQVRGNAWTIRSRGYAAILSPDGTPEKRYFMQIMDDALAYWEGQRGVTEGSIYLKHPNRLWAEANTKFDWSPLRFWGIETNTKRASIWQEAFLLTTFGMLRDMGFHVEPILKEYSKLLTTQINVPGYDPRYMCYYWAYTMHNNLTWYKTWNEFASENDALQYSSSLEAIKEFNNGFFYAVDATCAASFLTSYPKGPELWEFLKSNVFDRRDYSTSYTRSFIIYPRNFFSPVFPVTSIPPPLPPSHGNSTTSGVESLINSLSFIALLLAILCVFTLAVL